MAGQHRLRQPVVKDIILRRGLGAEGCWHGSFPSEEVALKLFYLALQNISAKCDRVQQ